MVKLGAVVFCSQLVTKNARAEIMIEVKIIQGVQVPVPREIPTKGRGSGTGAAFVKGARAAARGTQRTRCPYTNTIGSAKFQSAWYRGYDTFNQATQRSEQQRGRK